MGFKICTVLLLLSLLAIGGCVSRTAVTSQGGQAFVTKGSMLGTKMYYCDASKGRPECWQVTEQNLPEGGN